MYNEKLCNKYRRKFVNIHLITVVIISIIEIIAYIMLMRSGNKVAVASGRLYKHVILPIFLNVVLHIGVKSVCRLPELNYRIKDFAVIYTCLITCGIITLGHKEYPVAALSFVIPIIMLIVFNNKKLLMHAFVFAMAVISISGLLLYQSKKMVSGNVLMYSLVYVVVVIVTLVARIIIGFLRDSFRAVEKQSIEKTKINHMLKYDPMTGLYNRQAFFEHLNSFIADYNAKNEEFCIAVFDIDDFKAINEAFGYEEGDEVLITIAQCLRRHKTRLDKVFRYGGEEFVFLIKTGERNEAEQIINSVKEDIKSADFEKVTSEITFSCGIIKYDGNLSPQDLFDKANEVMHKAKSLGKNMTLTD